MCPVSPIIFTVYLICSLNAMLGTDTLTTLITGLHKKSDAVCRFLSDSSFLIYTLQQTWSIEGGSFKTGQHKKVGLTLSIPTASRQPQQKMGTQSRQGTEREEKDNKCFDGGSQLHSWKPTVPFHIQNQFKLIICHVWLKLICHCKISHFVKAPSSFQSAALYQSCHCVFPLCFVKGWVQPRNSKNVLIQHHYLSASSPLSKAPGWIGSGVAIALPIAVEKPTCADFAIPKHTWAHQTRSNYGAGWYLQFWSIHEHLNEQNMQQHLLHMPQTLKQQSSWIICSRQRWGHRKNLDSAVSKYTLVTSQWGFSRSLFLCLRALHALLPNDSDWRAEGKRRKSYKNLWWSSEGNLNSSYAVQ